MGPFAGLMPGAYCFEFMEADGTKTRAIRLFLCGDLMTGRGIDQILHSPCDPRLHEGYAQSAMDYIGFAEAVSGPIPRNVSPSYIWGAALEQFDRARPDARIVNLETAITHSDDFVPKGINYRMSPANADCLDAARIDCCVLANNHVLDWGQAGLLDTLASLRKGASRRSGRAGLSPRRARPPCWTFPAKAAWPCSRSAAQRAACPAIGPQREPLQASVFCPISLVAVRSASWIRSGRAREQFDIAVVSLHWGSNWGYDIAEDQRAFAHSLIDNAGVSIVYGHSSHHPRGIEVYRGRLILYGCGDFLNDYEGIRGHEDYRGDLALMYFVDLMPDGSLAGVELVPLRIRRFQLTDPTREETEWVQRTLDRESAKFGTHVRLKPDGRLELTW